jgi:hypothetical protein
MDTLLKIVASKTAMNTPALVSGLCIDFQISVLAHNFSANHLISKLNTVPRMELLFGYCR